MDSERDMAESSESFAVKSEPGVWDDAIDEEYNFYILFLNANSDADYLKQEKEKLMSQVETLQAESITLRRQIKMLQRELFTMSHKNSHLSYVIDALHDFDSRIIENRDLKLDMEHQLTLVSQERSNCTEFISQLQREVLLLQNKEDMDKTLMNSVYPRKHRLKELLRAELLETHQRSEGHKRNLRKLLTQSEQNTKDLIESTKSLSDESANVETLYLESLKQIEALETEIEEAEKRLNAVPETDESDGKKPKKKKKKKKAAKKGKAAMEEPETEEQKLQKEIRQMVSDARQLDQQSSLWRTLIEETLKRIRKMFSDVMAEHRSLAGVGAEIVLVRDYISRLHVVRKKMESNMADEEEDDLHLEQQKVILDIQKKEIELYETAFEQFLSALTDDYKMRIICLCKNV